MKSQLQLLMAATFISAVALISCKKESSSSLENLSELTKEVVSKPTLQEMRQGQAMLSIAERESLWKAKLNFILSNKAESFTNEQRRIIIKLQNFLNEIGIESLMANPSLGVQFMDTNLPYFSKHFNKAQLNILIESPLLNDNLLISKLTDENLAGTVGLMVSEGGYCTCLYDMGCPGGGNYCDQSGCTTNDDYEMCGLFGTSHCRKRRSDIEPVLGDE